MMASSIQWLICHKMSVDAIQKGSGVDALALGLDFLSSKDKLLDGLKNARLWVDAAILAIRQAAEPNPWRDSTDEEIATEIKRQIESRTTSKRISGRGQIT